MNLRSLTTCALVAMAALFVVTGCKHKNGDAAFDPDGDTVLPEGGIYDDSTGMALTGQPFDEIYSKVTDANIAPIYFGYDSFQLPPEELAKIDAVVRYLNDNPKHVLIVEGHCDERGSNEYNLSLGEQRALAVRSYIVNGGIDAARIQSRSFGEERPAAMGTGESVWRLNRRGEFAFYK